MFKVIVPSSSFEGVRCGVQFRKGVGETESREVAEVLAGFGYVVEGLEAKATPKKTAPKKKSTPKKED